MPDSLKITRQKRSGFFADCSRQEFERRLGRLREEMERSGVDGLLLTQQTNVRYATGFYEVGWIVPAYFYLAFIPRREDLPPAIFCPEGGQIQTEAAWVETVIRWDFPVGFYTGSVGDSLVQATAAWLRKLGLSQAHIATELSAHFRMGLSVECFDRIRAALPGVGWGDCGDIMWAVRRIKSSEEVRRLREACRISCLGVKAGFEAMREGKTERDIANVMSARMHAEGGSQIHFLALYAGPARALWADSTPRREMVLGQGSLLQFDGGCTYDGYFADFKRFACLGEPTADQRHGFESPRPASRRPSRLSSRGSAWGRSMRRPNRSFGRRAIPTLWTGARPWAGPASGTAWDWTSTRCPGFPLAAGPGSSPTWCCALSPSSTTGAGIPSGR